MLLSELLPDAPLTDANRGRRLGRRELEVVEFAVIGKTIPEIGILLSLSKHTVKRYLYSAFDKLGVNTRAGLVHLWISSVTEEQQKQIAELQTKLRGREP